MTTQTTQTITAYADLYNEYGELSIDMEREVEAVAERMIAPNRARIHDKFNAAHPNVFLDSPTQGGNNSQWSYVTCPDCGCQFGLGYDVVMGSGLVLSDMTAAELKVTGALSCPPTPPTIG